MNRDEADSRIELLLTKPAYVIDPLPERVPEGSGGQYFAIDTYWYDGKTGKKIYRKFRSIILKLYCYYDINVTDGEEIHHDPQPEFLENMIRRLQKEKRGHLWFLLDDGAAMITLDAADLNMTVYGPDGRMQNILRQLALAEGLFFWESPRDQ